MLSHTHAAFTCRRYQMANFCETVVRYLFSPIYDHLWNNGLSQCLTSEKENIWDGERVINNTAPNIWMSELLLFNAKRTIFQLAYIMARTRDNDDVHFVLNQHA